VAIPHRIGRHAHPKARPETPTTEPPTAPSGIDYLHLIDAAHQQHLAEQINYAALVDDTANGTPETDTP
jgi:putative transposase